MTAPPVRSFRTLYVSLLVAVLLWSTASIAAEHETGAHVETQQLDFQTVVDLLASGSNHDLLEVRRIGMLLFAVPFNKFDGFGDGPFDPSEGPPTEFGHRPTLQNNGMFLRVNGLDAQACNECHTVVSNATRPPTLGLGGAGTVAQNAMPVGTVIDVADSADDRTQFASGHDPDLQLVEDGSADYNGRFINPPFLFGGGGVELLGKEMTSDLQKLLVMAEESPAGSKIELRTHGVDFGYIIAKGGGVVELHPDGIGPVDFETADPREVLVVRPFGRKGENFSMRDFDRGATQFHFGIQPVEVVGEDVDEDRDGVVNEITVAEMSALHVFDVTNPRPRRRSLDPKTRAGLAAFHRVGCASCHRPTLTTRSTHLTLAHPEVATEPHANIYAQIDLRKAGFGRSGSGLKVPLFADLKRHKMGDRLAESCEACTEIANDEFTTARLWGIADTAPYLHDGRATTLFEAIEFHGGEAQQVRDDFLALSELDRDQLLAFLRTLRTPRRPNRELLEP